MSVKEKFMKNLVTLAFLVIIGLKATSQNIIPVEAYKAYWDAGKGVPDNSYIKDVNHLLDYHIGSWTGIQNGRTYVFEVEKELNYWIRSKEDRLVIRYTIYSANGALIADTRTLTSDDGKVLSGIFYNPSGGYLLNYSYNWKAGMSGQVYIRKGTVQNQMYLMLTLISDMISTELVEPMNSEVLLPTTQILLTKQ